MKGKDFIAPAGKFKVVKWVEDLDCIDPGPDWPVELGDADTYEAAVELGRTGKRGFCSIVIYDDQGNEVKK